jgi:NTP pyrophosphatase (non-canonical NTP hydrolase)
MDFSDISKRALEIQKKFPRQWDKKTQLINLMEEMGELCNAALILSGDKPEKRRRAELNDGFADVLFALIMTADEFEVDLEEVFLKALGEIEARIKEKEYEDE